jgi:2-succinyl-6-hydroxy-2,4-cyclohexadiene-1-carboxylate synthase
MPQRASSSTIAWIGAYVRLTGIIRAVAPTVTFVPGFMQRGEAWEPVAGRVATRYRSACLDFATHTYEGRLEEIERAVEPGDALVGYSMGGRLALHAALRNPDMITGPLVLVGVNAGIEDEQERAARREADDRRAARFESSGIEEVVDEWEKERVFASQSPRLREQQRPGRLSHRPQDLATTLRTAGQGALEPVWDRLPTLRAPALLVAGISDTAYATANARMARLIPDGRAERIPGAGHAPQLEQPDELTRLLLEFLDEHLGDRAVVDRDP